MSNTLLHSSKHGFLANLPNGWLAELPSLDFSTLPVFLSSASEWVVRTLKVIIPQGEPAAWLYEPVGDYPSRGGKHFRPALLLLATAACGGNPRKALLSAIALELFQNFALVHDDIEDESLLRRGRPALHLLHGIPLAINAGDLLFSLVYEVLACNRPWLGDKKSWQVQQALSEIIRHTLEGQALDIGWREQKIFPRSEQIQQMLRLKTAWYSTKGPCQIGALIASSTHLAEAVTEQNSHEAYEAHEESLIPYHAGLGDFGEWLGLGFQLKDDLLNFTEDSAAISPSTQGGGYGKEQGGDVREGKRTVIVAEMLDRLPPEEGEKLKDILNTSAPETQDSDVEWVLQRAHACGAIAAAAAYNTQWKVSATQALQVLPDSQAKNLLHDCINYLMLDRIG